MPVLTRPLALDVGRSGYQRVHCLSLLFGPANDTDSLDRALWVDLCLTIHESYVCNMAYTSVHTKALMYTIKGLGLDLNAVSSKSDRSAATQRGWPICQFFFEVAVTGPEHFHSPPFLQPSTPRTSFEIWFISCRGYGKAQRFGHSIRRTTEICVLMGRMKGMILDAGRFLSLRAATFQTSFTISIATRDGPAKAPRRHFAFGWRLTTYRSRLLKLAWHTKGQTGIFRDRGSEMLVHVT